LNEDNSLLLIKFVGLAALDGAIKEHILGKAIFLNLFSLAPRRLSLASKQCRHHRRFEVCFELLLSLLLF
jgi:hypothetical protein